MQERHQEIKFHPETLLPGPPPQENTLKTPPDNTDQTKPIPGGLVLKADERGHYRDTMLVNKIPIPFMIDTGASFTTIPTAMANKAGLPIGELGVFSTANGDTEQLSTQINSLKIGNAELKNIEASVNFKMDEAVIGMSTLKYFSISVHDNTMTLATTNSPDKIAIIGAPSEAGQKSAASIKKEVVCNSGGTDCKTSYRQSKFR